MKAVAMTDWPAAGSFETYSAHDRLQPGGKWFARPAGIG